MNDTPNEAQFYEADDKAAYIARLWLDAGKRRREVGRLQRIIEETQNEIKRIEALAKDLEANWNGKGVMP